MDEEQEYIYGQGLRKDFIEEARDLGSDAIDYAKENPAQSTGVGIKGVSLLGNLIKNRGITNYLPGQFFNSPVEKQFVKRGAANLSNPKYLKFLGQAGSKVAASRGVVPLTAALLATDAVKAKEGEALAEMRDIDAYQRDQEQAGIDRAQDIAMKMRKYNIIEEHRAAQENRLPYGYDPDFPEDGANINVTNFRDYLAQVPVDYGGPDELDFSLIDLSGQSEFPYYKDQSLNTGIDFSKFEQGEQPVTQPNLSAIRTGDQTEQPNLLTSSNPDFQPEINDQVPEVNDQVPESRQRSPLEMYTEYLGNLEKQGVSADERAEIANRMLAPSLRKTGDQSVEEVKKPRKSKWKDGVKRGRMRDHFGNYRDMIIDRDGNMTDAYIPSHIVEIVLKPPSRRTDKEVRRLAGWSTSLQGKGMGGIPAVYELIQGQAEMTPYQKASLAMQRQRVPGQRAPTSLEIQAATINQLVPIQQKLEAGLPISAEEEALYRQGSTLINLQQGTTPFGADPIFRELSSYPAYQQEDPSDVTVLPSSDETTQDPRILAFMASNKQFKTYQDAEKHLKEIGKI